MWKMRIIKNYFSHSNNAGKNAAEILININWFIMNNNKNPSNSSSVYEDEKIFKILEKVLSEGSVSVINRSNEIVGSLDKETISKFIYN